MTSEPPDGSVGSRSPNERELEVLRFLVGHDFPGANALRAETDLIRVRPSCGCGCASIALIPPGADSDVRTSPAKAMAPLEIDVLPSDDGPVGGMILWTSDGHLADLELFSFGDAPMSMPPVADIEVKVRT